MANLQYRGTGRRKSSVARAEASMIQEVYKQLKVEEL